MSLFYPTLMLERVSDIMPEYLKRLGVKALLLDVDNTLTTHNNPVPDKDALLWLESMRTAGITVCLASNNRRKRVSLFAESISADYVSRALKPLPVGFFRATAKLKLSPREFAVVGDQIFTDILGGNLFGAKTILVMPLLPEKGPFFRLKRRLEAGIIKRYRRRLKNNDA
jgi:HAD superfamily phosphatase (TIGR01668 family)